MKVTCSPKTVPVKVRNITWIGLAYENLRAKHARLAFAWSSGRVISLFSTVIYLFQTRTYKPMFHLGVMRSQVQVLSPRLL